MFLILFGIASYLLIGVYVSVWLCGAASEHLCSQEQKEESDRWMLILLILWPAALISYAIIALLEKIKGKKDGI